jgi:hypothetical protein
MEIQTDDVGTPNKSLQTTTETQTPPLTFVPVMPNQQQLQASVQKSIDIVQKSIATIQKSMDSVPSKEPTSMDGAVGGEPVKPNKVEQSLAAESQANVKAQASPGIQIYPELPPAAASKPKFQPALIVYDPSPKINAAVHQMMAMGYSNEGNFINYIIIIFFVIAGLFVQNFFSFLIFESSFIKNVSILWFCAIFAHITFHDYYKKAPYRHRYLKFPRNESFKIKTLSKTAHDKSKIATMKNEIKF